MQDGQPIGENLRPSASRLNRGEARACGRFAVALYIWALVTRGSRTEVYADAMMLAPRSKQVSDEYHLIGVQRLASHTADLEDANALARGVGGDVNLLPQ